jgi:hypothetical protein
VRTGFPKKIMLSGIAWVGVCQFDKHATDPY